jgi:predicted nucleotidyltransferase component of viral defense system
MNLGSIIQKMLKEYPGEISQADKLREILQQTALLGLARHNFFEHAIFYGGTALRILYDLDRYSEDLDFSLLQPNPNFDFEPFLNAMKLELEAMGFRLQVTVQKKNQESGIWSAFLKTNTLELLLSIDETSQAKGIHPEQKIQIKLEIDTDPPIYDMSIESKLIKNPIPFYVTTFRKIDLCAGKMHAVLCRAWRNRVKGRDWYDLIWYIQNGIPVNLAYLRAKMRQTRNLLADEKFTEKELHQKLEKRIGHIDWELAKADVKPFIPDKQKLDIWSRQFFLDLITHLRVVDDLN